jgi:streptogramin lyase
MHSGRVRNLYTAMAAIGIAVSWLMPAVARAQSEPMALVKFGVGTLGPIDIATGSDGNEYVTLSGGTSANGGATQPPQFAQIAPDGRTFFFGANVFQNAKFGAITAGPDGNVWFVDSGSKGIGRIDVTSLGLDEVIFVGSGALIPNDLATAPDNNIYFTESTGTTIGRITTDGAVTLFTAGIESGALIQRLTGGPDGNVWFTEAGLNRIGMITPAGRIFEFGENISPNAGLFDIKTGSDGNLWFTESNTGRFGRITPAGVVTEFQTGLLPTNGPFVLSQAPDGNLWFVEQDAGNAVGAFFNHNRFGKITMSGVVTEFFIDLPGLAFPDAPNAITAGPGNTLWFTQTGTDLVSQLTIDPGTSLAASVLPGGRTVGPGEPATVFASVINGGTAPATNCQVSLPADAPLGLNISYQPTDPTTNAPVGTQNTPFTLAAGATQSLLLTFQSATPVFAPGLQLNFNCTGVSVAPIEGVNTVDINFSADSEPDDIVLTAAATPGVVSVPVNGTGAFSVAMINVGGSGLGAPTQVSVDTGLSILPLTATLCMTNSTTGECLEPPAPTQFFSLPAGSFATFSVFVSASAAVPFDPDGSRVFIRFIDAEQLISVGSGSVAVMTTN